MVLHLLKGFFGKTFPKSRISVKIILMLPFDINVCKEIRWITLKKMLKIIYWAPRY